MILPGEACTDEGSQWPCQPSPFSGILNRWGWADVSATGRE